MGFSVLYSNCPRKTANLFKTKSIFSSEVMISLVTIGGTCAKSVEFRSRMKNLLCTSHLNLIRKIESDALLPADDVTHLEKHLMLHHDEHRGDLHHHGYPFL